MKLQVSQRMAQVLCLVKVMTQLEMVTLVRQKRVLVTETARVSVFNLLRLVLTKLFL